MTAGVLAEPSALSCKGRALSGSSESSAGISKAVPQCPYQGLKEEKEPRKPETPGISKMLEKLAMEKSVCLDRSKGWEFGTGQGRKRQ
jgi:hypothetical protein